MNDMVYSVLRGLVYLEEPGVGWKGRSNCTLQLNWMDMIEGDSGQGRTRDEVEEDRREDGLGVWMAVAADTEYTHQ
jgi:hypothetical protein